jgi:hypothetical protein
VTIGYSAEQLQALVQGAAPAADASAASTAATDTPSE